MQYQVDKDKILDDLPIKEFTDESMYLWSNFCNIILAAIKVNFHIESDKDNYLNRRKQNEEKTKQKPLLSLSQVKDKLLISKLASTIQRSNKIKVSPFRKFRAVARAITNFFFLLNYTRNFKNEMLVARDRNTSVVFGFTLIIVKNWFIDKFSMFFLMVINHDGSLDFTAGNNDKDENEVAKKRFQKVKPYVQYFFKHLIKMTNLKELPKQIIEYLHESYMHGATIEPTTVTKFEKDRIYMDEYNTLYNINQETKNFMRMYYMIGKWLLFITMFAEDGFGK